MFGILNLWKPVGPTSRDCVNRVQRLIRPTKVGHAGTLDPIAEGVLLVAVGQAVRLVDWIHRLPKTYCGTFELGKTSLSADTESEVTVIAGATIPTLQSIEETLPEFQGIVSQVPPIYSARSNRWQASLQKRASAGKSVEMPSRQVTIHHLSLVEYEYPKLVLEIGCGTGTYIRSLGRDMARRMGTDAIMTKLIRSSIGDMQSKDAVHLDELDSRQAIETHLCNPVSCLTQMPRVILEGDDIQRLHHGKLLELTSIELTTNPDPPEYVLALDQSGELRSILCRYDQKYWRPYRNFF